MPERTFPMVSARRDPAALRQEAGGDRVVPHRPGKAFARARASAYVSPAAPPRPLLAAGLAALVVGLAAWAALAAAPHALPTAAPGWRVRDAHLANGQGHLREGEAWVGQVPVQLAFLREMTASLRWEDDQPASAPDEFTLELVPPEGLPAPAPAEGKGGALQLRVLVYAGPPADAAPVVGTGSWTTRVYLRSAGDASTLGVAPGAPDGGNDFHLAVDAVAWERLPP
jgi:hypothetical protein